MQTEGWKKLGWQGLVFAVPESWDLSAYSGTYRKGYLRLDDSERIRLEVRWERPSRQVDIEDVVTGSLKTAAKLARRHKLDFRSKRHLKVNDPGQVRQECFRWTADVQAIDLVRQCGICGRLVYVRVLGEAGAREGLLATARRIFNGLTDHPDDDWILWRVFGLDARVQKGYGLSRGRLLAGRIYLCFRKASEVLEIERTALADQELKGCSVQEWLIGRLADPGRHTVVCEGEMHGHPLWIACRTKRSWWGARHAPQTLIAWHCEATNRLFSVALSRGGIDDLGRQARICCHELISP